MSELNARIIAKASATTAEEPLAADLEVAELAVNTADGKLFTKHTDGSVVTISGGGGSEPVSLKSNPNIYKVISTSLVAPSAPGEMVSFANSGGYIIRYFNISGYGNDFRFGVGPEGQVPSGTVLINGVPYEYTGSGNQVEQGNPSYCQFSISAVSNPFTIGDRVEFVVVEPLAIVDGDAYRYDETLSEWGAKSNGLMGLQDVQEKLSSVASRYLSENLWDGLFVAPANPGEWLLRSPSNGTDLILRLWPVDSDGNTIDLDSWVLDGTTFKGVTISDGGANTITISESAGTYVSQSGYHQIGSGWANWTAEDYVTWSNIAASSSLYILTTPQTTEAPAEGDVLTYSSERNAWVPAGASGAVDSVNGETGVVSLGVQEMDDYALNTTPPVSYSYPNSQGGGDTPQAAGYFREYNSSGVFSIQLHDDDENGNDLRAAFLLLSSPGSIWLSSDGVSFSEEPYETLATGGNIVIFQRTTGSWSVSSPLFLSLSDPGSPADVPLADGDILQWNNADQKFKPAQLPAAPVDSVNGETGVVSLGIQDMDDFGLNLLGGSNWDDDGSEGTSPTSAGSWSSVDSRFSRYAADGADLGTELDALAVGSDIWYGTPGGALTQGTVATVRTDFSATGAQGSNVGFREFTITGVSFSSFSASGISLAFSDPAASTAPLADGDILQWNNADQKFKPSSDHISLTTLKSEVAASADFADFQSRIAAL